MTTLLFSHSFTTRIHDIDAAGVVFFGRFFYHIHDAYESFLNAHQSGIDCILKSGVILPISHTEADFKLPLLLNEQINIDIFLHELTETEFILHYHLLDSNGIERASAVTHHVCLDKETKKRIALPDSINALFLK